MERTLSEHNHATPSALFTLPVAHHIHEPLDRIAVGRRLLRNNIRPAARLFGEVVGASKVRLPRLAAGPTSNLSEMPVGIPGCGNSRLNLGTHNLSHNLEKHRGGGCSVNLQESLASQGEARDCCVRDIEPVPVGGDMGVCTASEWTQVVGKRGVMGHI